MENNLDTSVTTTKNILTFIIPVRHPDNTDNWKRVKKNLRDTVRSITLQDTDGWQAVIVANHGADIPNLPPGFSVCYVDFPPNPLYRQGNADREKFWEAVRSDKGWRILAGLLQANAPGHIMIVDDDDFISKKLTSFVKAHATTSGWFIRDGYIWSDGGKLLYKYADFSRLCGTSHIVRADLYNIPQSLQAADEQYVRRMLGSHIFLHDHLDASGTPLEPLPFIGAIYRTGHADAHSRSIGIIGQFFLHKYLLRHPRELLKRLTRLRYKSHKIQREFFSDGTTY